MPPKKAAGGAPSKKTEQKKKEKVIEDKTFGLKNKKGTKQQKFIQHVTTQVQHGNKSAKALEAAKHEERKKKEAAKDEIAELNKILKPVAAMPKIAKDVDPKSVLCVFFKQGMCGKGDKCKWSHDLAVERKTEKRSVYHDNRDEDNMENWDDAKLAEVVDKKHGEKEKLKPKTEIICKYFLEALENSKYGWFWECPNGDSCIYRHALPPGYVLKKDKKKLDEASKQDQITLEELVEKERAALGNNLTKVTIETFLAWKKRKIREKQKKKADKDTKKQQEYKAGRSVGLSGRDLFTFNPDLIADDDEDDDGDVAKYEAEPEEDELIAHDIDESMFMEGIDLDAIDGNDDQPEQVNGVAAFNEDLFDDGDLPPDDDENECDLVANDVNKIRLKTNDE